MTRRLRHLTDPNPDGTPGVVPPALPAAPRTFTQDDMTALAAKEKGQGRDQAMREASDALGGMSIADAGVLIAAAKAADDANKTEAQRELATATADRAAATADRAAAATDRHQARLERILTTAGAVDVTIAARAVDVAQGADEATILAAVTAFKTTIPAFFTGPAAAPNTDAGKPPASGGAGKSAHDRAAAIAVARGWSKAS